MFSFITDESDKRCTAAPSAGGSSHCLRYLISTFITFLDLSSVSGSDVESTLSQTPGKVKDVLLKYYFGKSESHKHEEYSSKSLYYSWYSK